MPSERTQDWYEVERLIAGRCQKCGSKNLSPSEYCWGADGDEFPCAWLCADCGFDSDTTWRPEGRPYIAPGEPGSHDTSDDYEDDD